jgi:hypothetical protein
MAVPLDDHRLDKLVSLIKDSFRVRPNQDPVYVDMGGNLDRVASAQHQVIFGRRGSGKSCLLVHFHRQVAEARGVFSIYLDADEIKRLGYPDVLIRLLLTLTEKLPGKRRRGPFKRFRKPTALEAQAAELRRLLDLADESDVTEGAEAPEGREGRGKDKPRSRERRCERGHLSELRPYVEVQGGEARCA